MIKFVIVLIFLLNTGSFSQGNYYKKIHLLEQNIDNNEIHTWGYWVSFGIGSSHFGPTLKGSLSIAYVNNIFSIRYLQADEFRFSPGGYTFDDPPFSIKERGILYGRSYKKKQLLLSLSAGVGFINGIDRGTKIDEKRYEPVNISTYGIAFEAKFQFEIGVVGIGGTWFGNVNKQKILSGGMLEISLGKF